MSSTPGDYLYGGRSTIDLTIITWYCGACDAKNQAPGDERWLERTVRPCRKCGRPNLMPEGEP